MRLRSPTRRAVPAHRRRPLVDDFEDRAAAGNFTFHFGVFGTVEVAVFGHRNPQSFPPHLMQLLVVLAGRRSATEDHCPEVCPHHQPASDQRENDDSGKQQNDGNVALPISRASKRRIFSGRAC